MQAETCFSTAPSIRGNLGSALALPLASFNVLLPLHHLSFPIPVSVCVAPGEQEETHLILKEIDDDQINEEMTVCAHKAELEADAHPLPTIQEEPQEEENR